MQGFGYLNQLTSNLLNVKEKLKPSLELITILDIFRCEILKGHQR